MKLKGNHGGGVGEELEEREWGLDLIKIHSLLAGNSRAKLEKKLCEFLISPYIFLDQKNMQD